MRVTLGVLAFSTQTAPSSGGDGDRDRPAWTPGGS